VWADGEVEPNTSDINFLPGETRANLVVAHVGPSGVVDVRLSTGKARMIMDVVGYLAASGTMGYSPVPQYRVLDTRNSSPIAPGGTLDVNLGFSPSVAVISLTVLGASGPGYLAAYRPGKTMVGLRRTTGPQRFLLAQSMFPIPPWAWRTTSRSSIHRWTATRRFMHWGNGRGLRSSISINITTLRQEA
jgi:hypothetical protein